MQNPIPSPTEHPNGYVGVSSGAITAFLVAEAKRRFNLDLSIEEATYIVAGVTAAFLFFGKRRAK